jgi:hypothetical protein
MNTRAPRIPRFAKILVIWLIIILWPFLLVLIPPLKLIPFLGPIAFIQIMFLINIPGLPLARALGLPHFKIEEFGALPNDSTAYALIVLFWVLVAVVLALATATLTRWGSRKSTTQRE